MSPAHRAGSGSPCRADYPILLAVLAIAAVLVGPLQATASPAAPAPAPTVATPTGVGRPPAGYPPRHPTPSRKPARSAAPASVTNPQGDSLSVGIPVVGSFNSANYQVAVTANMGLSWYYENCTQPAAGYGGALLPFCSFVQVTDSVGGSTVSDNNTQDNTIYDACGTLVEHQSTYGWHLSGTSYLRSGWIGTIPTSVPTSGVCYGQWTVSFTFSQTFADGATLSETATGGFTVYPTQGAVIAAQYPQQSPSGGPVQASETLGGNPVENRCQTCAGDPVNTATGDYYESYTDLSIPGRGPALSLTRSYNSLRAGTDGPFGYGWTSSYGMSLAGNSDTAVITQGDGSQVSFSRAGRVWSPAPRVLALLAQETDGSWRYATRRGDTYRFDPAGRLVSLTDSNGYQTTLGYPSASSMVVTDPAGRTLTLALAGGHVTSATDSASPPRSLTYGYDQAGNLTDVVDVGGGHTQFGYDSAHRLLTARSPRFYGDTTTTPAPVTTNHYDPAGRVDWQSDPLGRVTSFDYTSIPGSTRVTDPKGNVTVDEYQYGLLTAVTRGYGTARAATWYYRYDQITIGQTLVVDPDGHTTKSVYDTLGNLTSTTDALNRTTSYTYNSLGEVTSVTEPKTVNGSPVTTTTTYDSAGNVLTRSAPLIAASGATTATATTTYSYGDPAHPGCVTSVTDPNNNTVSYTYDAFGDVLTTTDGAGGITSFGYDTARGWRTSMVSAKGHVAGANPAAYTTTYAYDSYGRPTVTRSPLWNPATPSQQQTVRHYDADGNTDSVTDGNNHTTTYTFDAAGEQTAIHRPDGSTLRTDYWPDGLARHQYDGADQPTGYDYDPLGRLTSITDPLNQVTSLNYDPAGNLLTRTDPAGRVTSNGYDAADQLISTTYSDGVTPNVSNIGYDADGQRTAMTDGTGTTTWTWDTLHRMTGSTTGAGQTVGYQYDLGSRLTAITYPGGTGTVQRGYDNANRLHTVTDWNGKTTTFDYDPDGNLRTEAYPNGITATHTYDAADRLAAVSDAPAANPNAALVAFGYGRDGGNLIKSVTSTGVPADNHTFGYDQADRLTGVDQSSYGYDAADNLTKQLDGTQQIFDAAHRLQASTTKPAISLVGTATAGDSTSTSLTVPLPAGTAVDDQVIVATTMTNGKSVTTPAGYTVVGTFTSGTANSATKVVVLRHLVAAGDTSVPLAYQTKFAKSVVVASYRGVHPTSPVDVSSSGFAAPGTVVAVPSVTTTTSGERLLMITGATGTAGTWAMASQMTERAQRIGGSTDTALADEARPVAGQTDTRVAAHNTTSTPLVGVLVALKAAQTSYGYDQTGNRTAVSPLTGAATSLGYDQANRLTGYAGAATYRYDGTGLRAAKTVSGTTTTFTWDRAEGIPQLLTAGGTSYVYGPGGVPVEQIGASGTLYLHLDQLGSVRALTDSTGTVVATYSYDPYGRLTGRTGTADTALRWAGQYTDPESGLVYLRARYYDPVTGQFITRDPLEDRTQAPYSYLDDSPLNGLDLTGLCWGPDIRCKAQHLAGRVANDVYHPVRFAVTSPLTAVTVSVDKLGYGADCDWNSRNWVVICYGAPTVLNAPATTFGGAVNSKVSRERFAAMNCGRLLAHETKHTDQWAVLGPVGFLVEDGIGAGASELFWGDNAHNPIEMSAGLKDGGYTPCC